MKKIIAIGGSNSKTSINKQLATYIVNQIKNSEAVIVDLNDFNLPIYGIDLENEQGVPKIVTELNTLIFSADAIVISLAEHNGSYTTAFKNVLDWLSRINQKVWKNKPMFLAATSPGKRGGITVLEAAKSSFPHLGANIIADFSLPSFFDNFNENKILDKAINSILTAKIKEFENAL